MLTCAEQEEQGGYDSGIEGRKGRHIHWTCYYISALSREIQINPGYTSLPAVVHIHRCPARDQQQESFCTSNLKIKQHHFSPGKIWTIPTFCQDKRMILFFLLCTHMIYSKFLNINQLCRVCVCITDENIINLIYNNAIKEQRRGSVNVFLEILCYL